MMQSFRNIHYALVDEYKGKINVKENKDSKSIVFNYPCDDTSVCSPYLLYLPKGYYKIELWGAQGGDSREENKFPIKKGSGGKGSYVSGNLRLDGKRQFYLYLGGKGQDQNEPDNSNPSKGGYNGGGKGGVDLADTPDIFPESSGGGGGSSDIRLIPDMTLNGLKSRIIVAGAGGGAVSTSTIGKTKFESRAGDGGSLEGNTYNEYLKPGTQQSGLFGKGQDGVDYGIRGENDGGSIGGCGSGYYGGTINAPIAPEVEISGVGGSSFISGHSGCIAVVNDASDPPNHINGNIHYSGISFTETVMKTKGSQDFVDPFGVSEDGHFGNGVARITVYYSEPLIYCRTYIPHYYNIPSLALLALFVVTK